MTRKCTECFGSGVYLPMVGLPKSCVFCRGTGTDMSPDSDGLALYVHQQALREAELETEKAKATLLNKIGDELLILLQRRNACL